MKALATLPKYRAISFRGWPFFVPAGFLNLLRGITMSEQTAQNGDNLPIHGIPEDVASIFKNRSEASPLQRLQDIQFELHKLHCVAKLLDGSDLIPDPEHGSISLIGSQLSEAIDRVSEVCNAIEQGGAS